MRQLRYTPAFEKEIKKFPETVREDLFQLISLYLAGERLPKTSFKTFSLDKQVRIQEFKVKDSSGNWRAISCLEGKKYLTFVYAFHKKSQKLLEKEKKLISKRVKEIL